MAGRLAHRAWDSLGNGALFSPRIPLAFHCQPATRRGFTFHTLPRPRLELVFHLTRLPQRPLHATPTRRQQPLAQEKSLRTSPDDAGVRRFEDPADRDDDEDEVAPAFKSSDKAAAARHVNLSARLSKDDGEGDGGGRKGGVREVGRLLAIARPEVRTLGAALACLLVSSSISMSVPFSVGESARFLSSEMCFAYPCIVRNGKNNNVTVFRSADLNIFPRHLSAYISL